MSDETITGEQGITNQQDMTPEAAARERMRIMQTSYAAYWRAFALGVLAKDWEHLPEYGTFEAWRDASLSVGKPSIDQLAQVVEILAPTMTYRQISATTQQSLGQISKAAAGVQNVNTSNARSAAARTREARRQSTPVTRAEAPGTDGRTGGDRNPPDAGVSTLDGHQDVSAGELSDDEHQGEEPPEVTADDDNDVGHQDDRDNETRPRERQRWPKTTTLSNVTFNYGTTVTLTFNDGSVMHRTTGLFDSKYRDSAEFKAVVKLLGDMWQSRWMEIDRAVRENYRKQRE